MFLWGILEEFVGFLDSLFDGKRRHYHKSLITHYLHVVRYATSKTEVVWHFHLHFKILHAACSVNHVKIIAHRILRCLIMCSKVAHNLSNLRS